MLQSKNYKEKYLKYKIKYHIVKQKMKGWAFEEQSLTPQNITKTFLLTFIHPLIKYDDRHKMVESNINIYIIKFENGNQNPKPIDRNNKTDIFDELTHVYNEYFTYSNNENIDDDIINTIYNRLEDCKNTIYYVITHNAQELSKKYCKYCEPYFEKIKIIVDNKIPISKIVSLNINEMHYKDKDNNDNISSINLNPLIQTTKQQKHKV